VLRLAVLARPVGGLAHPYPRAATVGDGARGSAGADCADERRPPSAVINPTSR
jgi:hypothetical protein